MSRTKNISSPLSDEQVKQQLELDKQSVNTFLEGKAPFNFQAYKRLLMTDLMFSGLLSETGICGFAPEQIRMIVNKPERYGKQILKLSQFMYLKSGYYRRLIDYYVNMAKYCWTVDTEVKTIDFYKVQKDTLKSNLIKFIAQVNKLKLEHELHNILHRMFLNDGCFGYLVETKYDTYIHYLRPQICEVYNLVNGMFTFAIVVNSLTKKDIASFPDELQVIVGQAQNQSVQYIEIPYDKVVCFKYNDFTYLYPPMFQLIGDILDIDDYKSLAKSRTESDCYRLIALKIPTTDDGQLAVGDDVTIPFTGLVKDVVHKSVGVFPTPFDATPIEFKTDNTDRDKVNDSVDALHSEGGVSRALMEGATSGSELKMSVTVDSGDIFKIYRQIERSVNFQMKLRGNLYPSYGFSFSMLDITIFNQDEVVDRELKLAQVSIPNKLKLLSSNGITPAKALGNEFIENDILEMGKDWTVLKTSATQTSEEINVEKNGRPTKSDTEISRITETTRDTGGNDPNNRV